MMWSYPESYSLIVEDEKRALLTHGLCTVGCLLFWLQLIFLRMI